VPHFAGGGRGGSAVIGANIMWAVLLAGAAAIGRALWQWRRARELHDGGVAVMGVVTDVRVSWRSSGDSDRRIVRCVLRFDTEDGRTVETVSSEVAGTSARAEVGESVPVVYDPEDPQRARIEGISGNEVFTWAITGVAGGSFCVIALWTLL
jgi:hypothetical protein